MAMPMRTFVLPIGQILNKICANFALSSLMNVCGVMCTKLRPIRTVCTVPKQHFIIDSEETKKVREKLPQLQTLVSSQTLFSHSREIIPRNRFLHTSTVAQSFEEFFEDKKNLGEDKIKSGRPWKIEELRLKDNVMLQKLWFVLLKERNMLMTMEEEAQRQQVFMPGYERLDKVQESMNHLRRVIQERDEALNELRTGQKGLHPGKWVYTPFGYKRFVRPQEHLIPFYMNKYAATKRKHYGKYIVPYMRQWMEQVVTRRRKERRSARNKMSRLRKQFPDSDYWKED